MVFASPIPWWIAVLVAIGIGGIAFLSYRRPLVPLTSIQRAILIGLRGLALAAVAVFVCRPVLLLPTPPSGEVVIPVLVDVSRSMGIADAGGDSRINRARGVLEKTLTPGLGGYASIEVLAFGDSLSPTTADHLTADARRTDLAKAVDAARDRYRGRPVPAIVVLSEAAIPNSRRERLPSRPGQARRFTRSASALPKVCRTARLPRLRRASRVSIRRRSTCTSPRSRADSARSRLPSGCARTDKRSTATKSVHSPADRRSPTRSPCRPTR